MHLLCRRKYQGVSKQMRTELKFSILQCFITTSLLELARDKKTVVFTGKTKNTLWPVLLQFFFSLQSLNYRFLLKKYDGKARVFDLLCCEEKTILTKTLPPFVWVKAIKKIKSKLLNHMCVTIKMNTVIYRLFCIKYLLHPRKLCSLTCQHQTLSSLSAMVALSGCSKKYDTVNAIFVRLNQLTA